MNLYLLAARVLWCVLLGYLLIGAAMAISVAYFGWVRYLRTVENKTWAETVAGLVYVMVAWPDALRTIVQTDRGKDSDR